MRFSGRWKVLGKMMVLATLTTAFQQDVPNHLFGTERNATARMYEKPKPQTIEDILSRLFIGKTDIAVADVPMAPIDLAHDIEAPVADEIPLDTDTSEMLAVELDEDRLTAAMQRTYIEMLAEASLAKRNLVYNFIANQESNKFTILDDGFVRQDPILNFYFCPAGGLTIGYGTLIPFEKNKRAVAREGIELLDKLVILDTRDNNRPLTLDEKKQLALDLRASWVSAGCPTDWKDTAYIHPDFQDRGENMDLFVRYRATPESSWDAMCFEVGQKLDRMDGVEITTFIQTIAADSVYRRGYTGLTESSEYDHLQRNVITQEDAENTPTYQRNLARNLVMQLHDLQKQNPFNLADSDAKQAAQFRFLMVQTIALSVQHYKTEIQNGNDDVPLKVSLVARLAAVQMAENVAGRPLNVDDIQRICSYTDDLIYRGFFAARDRTDLDADMREDAVLLTADVMLRQSQAALGALKTHTASLLPQSEENQGQDTVLLAIQSTLNLSVQRLQAVADVGNGRRVKTNLNAAMSSLAEPVYAARSLGILLKPSSDSAEKTSTQAKPKAKTKTKTAPRKRTGRGR